MKEIVIGILIIGLLIVTAFPTVSASIHKTDEKENEITYESRIFGIGFVRIHSLTHVIKGFVLFGINNGEVILKEFVKIKFSEVDGIFAGFFSPYQLIFYIRYNPA